MSFLIKINEHFYILFMFGINIFAFKNAASCQNIFSCEEIFCELLLTTKLKYVFSQMDWNFVCLFIIYLYTFQKTSRINSHLFHMNKV